MKILQNLATSCTKRSQSCCNYPRPIDFLKTPAVHYSVLFSDPFKQFRLATIVDGRIRVCSVGVMTPTPWNIVLPVQLTVPQPVKIFPVFYKPEIHYRVYKCRPPVLVLRGAR